MNILAKTFFVAGHETTILGAILIALSFVLIGYFFWVAWVNAIPAAERRGVRSRRRSR